MGMCVVGRLDKISKIWYDVIMTEMVLGPLDIEQISETVAYVWACRQSDGHPVAKLVKRETGEDVYCFPDVFVGCVYKVQYGWDASAYESDDDCFTFLGTHRNIDMAVTAVLKRSPRLSSSCG
jgi:hypothetical protein